MCSPLLPGLKANTSGRSFSSDSVSAPACPSPPVAATNPHPPAFARSLPWACRLQNGTKVYRYPSLQNCALPKLFLSGDHDQFAPVNRLEQVAASAADPKQFVLIPGADHFFTGHLEAMQLALAGWLKEQFP